MSTAASDFPEHVQFVTEDLSHVLPRFTALAAAYRQHWGLTCVLADVYGRVVAGDIECAAECALSHQCAAARQRAIAESVRWGEPSVQLCPQENLLWGVPVMDNTHVIGGLIATRSDADSAVPLSPKEIHLAVLDLLDLATTANLTNHALLALQRVNTQREGERAKAIHELKGQNYESIREIYLTEEPGLIAAIKGGDRRQARGVINRVLVGIYYLGRDRPLLLKSFLLELVVMMSRSAVEAGADPSELLGANFSLLGDLAAIDDEEALSAWLVAMLERIMDAISVNQHYPIGVMLGRAIQHMQAHLHEDISRDDIAAIACLSPSHFSRVIKQVYGQSFTELLTQMRVDRAREMLVRTEKSLIQICLECGFSDQSYFTKVFQKTTGKPPGEFRRLNRSF
ncbi:MAG TPA: AraC family transcriptional regulator [Anaerolineae bacterium]|jgi:AraC-like DNA-binding protein